MSISSTDSADVDIDLSGLGVFVGYWLDCLSIAAVGQIAAHFKAQAFVVSGKRLPPTADLAVANPVLRSRSAEAAFDLDLRAAVFLRFEECALALFALPAGTHDAVAFAGMVRLPVHAEDCGRDGAIGSRKYNLALSWPSDLFPIRCGRSTLVSALGHNAVGFAPRKPKKPTVLNPKTNRVSQCEEPSSFFDNNLRIRSLASRLEINF
jgi:hypothetical protein